MPLSINKFPHILRCHNDLRICEFSMYVATWTKQIKRLVDEKAPPSCRDGVVTMKALTGDVHDAISHFSTAGIGCRFGSEVNGCASWKSRHFCIASCEASQSISSDFLLHLLLLPYLSCCLCNLSLNVHMSAHWQICKYGSGTGTRSCSHVGLMFRMTNHLGLWSTLANRNLLSSAFLERQELALYGKVHV